MNLSFAAVAAAALVVATPAFSQSSPAQRPINERLAESSLANRHRLEFDGKAFSGPAWELLVRDGSKAQFFLLGEEHGIAENPKFAAALFSALGYLKFMIEVSPPMAAELDAAARNGVEGLKEMYATPGSEPAFYGMAEEAEMLASVRKSVKNRENALWGVDYEVSGDRLLIATLEGMKKPEAAERALAALKKASLDSWAQYEATRNPQFIYSFAGDPALVRAVRDAWPKRNDEATSILKTLEETFEINKLWIAGKGYASNERRSEFMRQNFLAHWRAEKAARRSPKVFAKLGSSHMVRGRNNSEVFDLGSLMPEIAALEGSTAFQLLVLPGKGSPTAVFDPTAWNYREAPPRNDYAAGLEPITNAAFPDAFTLIDVRPLRSILSRSRPEINAELMRVVHGYDAVLVMSGSTASANLVDAAR